MLLLKKALGVLEALGAAGSAISLAELTRRVKFPKPTVYRIVRTLVDVGYASQEPASGAYALTARLWRLGGNGKSLELRRRALPLMERLHRAFNETVNLAVLEETDVVYLHVLETTRPLRLMTTPDARDPFHTTSLGRAIAAFLPDAERRALLNRLPPKPRAPLEGVLRKAKRRGWAEDREENEPGVVCFGAPILEEGLPVAALSVTLPSVRLSAARERQIIAELTKTVRAGLST